MCGIKVYARRHPIVRVFLACCTSGCILGRLFLKRKSHMAYNIKLLSSHLSPPERRGTGRGEADLSSILKAVLFPALVSPLFLLSLQPRPGTLPGGWREKGQPHWLAGLERMRERGRARQL